VLTGTVGLRLKLALATFAGTAFVAVPFAMIELWSNLWHDPFYPNVKAQAWAAFAFSLYGAAFVGAMGCGATFLAMTVLRLRATPVSRSRLLAFGLLGAVLYVLLHHSKHVLWYWEAGGTW
jgi:hypothetical protein